MTEAVTGFKFSVDEPRDSQSPLIRFKGVLKGYKAVAYKDENNPAAKERMTVEFEFTDVTVIESHEPYPFPVATIKIGYSDRKETLWAAWTKSFRERIPHETYANEPGQPFDVIVGKEQEWARMPADLRRPLTDEHNEPILDAAGKQKWGVQPADAWQLVYVEGFGQSGENITDLIVEEADGKTDKEIMQWIYTEQSLKRIPGYSEAVEAMAERKLMPTLVSGGKLTQDTKGVYHKV
jgi:hypothetical protein